MRRRPSPYDLLVDSDYYESLEHYRPALPEFFDRVQACLPSSWHSTRLGLWFGWHPPCAEAPLQGWKVHISSTIANSAATLDAVVPICVARRVSFKHALDLRVLALINGKHGGREQSGKFVTIYPHHKREFLALLEELAEATNAFDGPMILTDRRYASSKVVQYRYGGMSPVTRIDVTGRRITYLVGPEGELVRDERRPEFHVPPWVADPFPPGIDEDASEATLKNSRYLVRCPLDFSTAGGIYIGEDRTTGREVIIKEARPHIEVGLRGGDAVDALKNEWSVLTTFAQSAITPKPIDLFQDWEHWFLVEEKINGLSLTRYSAAHSIASKQRNSAKAIRGFWTTYRATFNSLARALNTLHNATFVFGDLSPNNVIVNLDTLKVTFIDLETAHAVGGQRVSSTFTPGFVPLSEHGVEAPSQERDCYALGAMMLRYLLPMGALIIRSPKLLDRFLLEWRVEFHLPSDIEDLIRGLLEAEPHSRPTARVVGEVLSRSPESDVHSRHGASGPAPSQIPLAAKIVEGGVHHILNAASFDRHDRLFPANPAVFETNPLSIAFGACGVAHVLQRMLGECPRPVIDWITNHRADARSCGPGLYSGLAGIAWAFHDLALYDEAEVAFRQAINHPRLFDSADLFNGAGGVGMAALALSMRTNDKRYADYSAWCAEEILARAQTRDTGLCWLAPDGKAYYGLGHGASGVALFLLYLHLATLDERWLRAGQRALAFDLAGVSAGDDLFLWPYGEDTSGIRLPYFEFGAAGVGAAVLRYQLVAGSEQYRTVLQRILSDAAHKYAAFPGYLMGLAGLGQFFIDVAVLSGDDDAWMRAQLVADGVRLFALERADGYAFPTEYHYRLGCDFGTGAAGAVLFLDNLLHRRTSSFMLDELLARSNQSAETSGPRARAAVLPLRP
jgi:serine/threonine protein kinase